MVKNTLGGYKGKTEIESNAMQDTETKPKRKYIRKNKTETNTITDVVENTTSTECENKATTPPVQKRKYVRKKKPEDNETIVEKETKTKKGKKTNSDKTSSTITDKPESHAIQNSQNITDTSNKEHDTESKDEHTITTTSKETIIEHSNDSNILQSNHNSLDPSFEFKESFLKTHRFKYQDKIKFLSSFMDLLQSKQIIDCEVRDTVVDFLKNNSIQELHHKNEKPFASVSSFEDEMEEHTLTVIKYEYQGSTYLKDEDGNLYDLESPHDFILNIYDNDINL
jgi:hypothetical protein